MPIISHKALIPAEDQLEIWRYLDLDKFESLLNTSSLFFCRTDKFSDPFEGSVPKKEFHHRAIEQKKISRINFKKILSDEDADESSKSIGEFHKRLKRCFVVNCWHINDGESDAMWRLYLKTNEGVAIKTTVSKLKESFLELDEDVFISRVRYLDFENDIWYHKYDYPITGYNMFSPMVHKRKAFIHENELRIFQKLQEPENDIDYWEKASNNIGKFIQCNIHNLIEKVILPPTADEKVERFVNNLMDKYSLKCPLDKSKLVDQPYY